MQRNKHKLVAAVLSAGLLWGVRAYGITEAVVLTSGAQACLVFDEGASLPDRQTLQAFLALVQPEEHYVPELLALTLRLYVPRDAVDSRSREQLAKALKRQA